MLQQHLPLAVLKQLIAANLGWARYYWVATTPTACGIETATQFCAN